MFERLSRALDALTSFALLLAAVALAATCLLILFEIGLRNFWNATTGISVEYSAYLLVFMVFAALAHTQRSGTMIYMELGYDRYPAKLRRVLNAFRWTVGVAFGAVVIWQLWHFTSRTCSLGQVSMFPSRTPLCGPQAIMIVGMAVLTLEFLRGAIVAWRNLFLGIEDAEPAEQSNGIALKDMH